MFANAGGREPTSASRVERGQSGGLRGDEGDVLQGTGARHHERS
jgi:hypothetical protein